MRWFNPRIDIICITTSLLTVVYFMHFYWLDNVQRVDTNRLRPYNLVPGVFLGADHVFACQRHSDSTVVKGSHLPIKSTRKA